MLSAESYTNIIVNNKLKTLLLVFLLFIISASGAVFLQFSMDYQIFFGGKDKHLYAYEEQQKIYSKNDSVLIAIEPEMGSVFNFDLLKVIRRYTHESWTLPEVSRVDSLTNFQDSFAQNNILVIQELVNDEVSFDQALLEYVKKIALNEPALKNKLVSEDGRYTGIALTVQLPDGPEKNKKVIELVKEVRALASRIESEEAVKKTYLSGTVMINNAFFEVSKADMLTLMPIMFLLIVFLMTILVKSFYAAMIVFLIVGMSVSTAFGLASYMGVQLTPPAVAAAPIIMMLAIADGIHVLSSFFKHYTTSSVARLECVHRSISENFVPVTLTTITTIIGFLTMNFSESPPFHDLGNMVAIGIAAAYLFTLTVLPIALFLLPVKPSNKRDYLSKPLSILANRVIENRLFMMGITVVAICTTIVFIPKNEFNDEFVKYFDRSIRFRVDNDFITEKLTGVYQIEYSIPSQEEGGVSDPSYLSFLERFAVWFREQKDVVHVQSVADIYKKAHMNLQEGKVEEYRIPDSRETAAQALLAYELSLPRGLDLNDQIDIGKSSSKFVVTLKTISARDLIALEDAANNWVKDNGPSYLYSPTGTGPAVLFSHIGMRSISSGLLGGIVALVLICIILSLVFRSIKLGLISLIPNLFPVAMGFGVWALIYGKINMALATVISMTLGIIVDDTIHFIARYVRERKQGLSSEEAIRITFVTVGKAIVLTTLVLVGGFCVLLFSPFVMNWGMGLLSAITILFALLTDLLLLPAFLIYFEKSFKGNSLVKSELSSDGEAAIFIKN